MTINKEAPVICWLRRDLRLHDHAALFHAVKTGAPLQLIFIFDEKILAPLRSESADQRLSFIIEALGEIETTLAQRGGSLKILHGDRVTVLPDYAAAIGAQALFYNEDLRLRKRTMRFLL